MWFSKKNKEEAINKEMPTKYLDLDSLHLLDVIDNVSTEKVMILFKHSTRCIISRTVLKNFESAYNLSENKAAWYLLDLLNHRDISNEIANRYGITHQSPQILVIKNKQCVYHDSHDGIDFETLKMQV
jgi:bacillithiol system protein YtxJ